MRHVGEVRLAEVMDGIHTDVCCRLKGSLKSSKDHESYCKHGEKTE